MDCSRGRNLSSEMQENLYDNTKFYGYFQSGIQAQSEYGQFTKRFLWGRLDLKTLKKWGRQQNGIADT